MFIGNSQKGARYLSFPVYRRNVDQTVMKLNPENSDPRKPQTTSKDSDPEKRSARSLKKGCKFVIESRTT